MAFEHQKISSYYKWQHHKISRCIFAGIFSAYKDYLKNNGKVTQRFKSNRISPSCSLYSIKLSLNFEQSSQIPYEKSHSQAFSIDRSTEHELVPGNFVFYRNPLFVSTLETSLLADSSHSQ